MDGVCTIMQMVIAMKVNSKMEICMEWDFING